MQRKNLGRCEHAEKKHCRGMRNFVHVRSIINLLIANGVTTKNLKGDNTVSISVFNALSIDEGLVL